MSANSASAGMGERYPIDAAQWIWHPGPPGEEIFLVRFTLTTEHATSETLRLDVSADQRYILSVDGQEIDRGPDRAELWGWSFHRYEVTLEPGTHHWEVTAWWLPVSLRPVAQVSAKPAFALVGLGEADAPLSTGTAPWRVRRLSGWSPRPKDSRIGYHVIGCGFVCDGEENGPELEPVRVAAGNPHLLGTYATPWRCEPSPLPAQERKLFSGGTLRGESGNGFEGLCLGNPVTIPAHTHLTLLWDFEEYLCAYPRMHLREGKGATVEMEWAESLYLNENPDARSPKGNRADHEGKTWLGFGDIVHHPGGERRVEPLWWRSGRWLRVRVETAEAPLTIVDARPLRTGYPFARRWAFQSDRDFAGMLDLCENGLRNCVHETFVDCPYFEQMQYLGDTRVQALVWMVATGDSRPVLRALELFNRSRWVNGFHAERCPTGDVQMSATYSLVFPPLLRDFAWWCDDPDAVRYLLPGMRSALEEALACVGTDGLPEKLPGWLFVDWVNHPFWTRGVPGLGSDPVSSPVALHLPIALDAAAQVEDAYGDPDLASRWRRESRRVTHAIFSRFGGSGLLSDDPGGSQWSEHAQALALDCRETQETARPDLVRALLESPEAFAKASVYFSHHVHEALLKAGEVDAFLERLDFWNALREQGFLTTVECPEPSRSDCHGWGAHPLYHCLTGLAGIRPSGPGFARVRVTPRFGTLTRLEATVPHPRGEIRVILQRDETSVSGEVHTPVAGEIVWNGRVQPLTPGRNLLS